MGNIAINTLGMNISSNEFMNIVKSIKIGALMVSAIDNKDRFFSGIVFIDDGTALFEGEIVSDDDVKQVLCTADQASLASERWTIGEAVEVESEAEAVYIEASSYMSALSAIIA